MVQSARIQQVVKGDDVILAHQIMTSVAYAAEKSRAPVLVNEGDIANFFYPRQDGTVDLIGYTGLPVGSYPTSQFTVPIPGVITPLTGSIVRGTSQMESGPGETVRAEILRLKVTATGITVTNGTALLTGFTTVAGLQIGQLILGTDIPTIASSGAPTLIESIDPIGLTVTMTQNATGNATESIQFFEKETHYSIDEVDVFERGFPINLKDTSGGIAPPQPPLNLT